MSDGCAFRGRAPTTTIALPATRQGLHPVRSKQQTWPLTMATSVIVVIVLIAPVPLASNHPLAWLFWATILGATGAAVSAATNHDVRPDRKTYRTFFVLGYIFIGFGLFQAAPLPLLQGGVTIKLPAGPVSLPSLSIAPTATLIATIRLTSYLIFFWLVLIIAGDPTHAKRIAKLLFFGIMLHALLALLALKVFDDVSFVADKSAFFGQATGTFVNKNSFATYLGMGAVLGLALILNRGLNRGLHRRQKRQAVIRFSYMLSLAIILATLLLTQSRMGIAATGVALLLVVLGSQKSRRRMPSAVLILAALTLASVAVTVLTGFGGTQSAWSTRLDLYKQLVWMITARPLTGFGWDSFALAFEMYHAPPVTSDQVWQRAHSTYLKLWIESGVIFGSLPLIAGAIAARRLWQRLTSALPGRTLALAGGAALVLGGLHSVIDFSLEIQANAFLLLALIGLGLGPGLTAKGQN